MNERTYKAVSNNAIASFVLGIISVCTGVAIGTILIVSGAKALKKTSELIF
jgi:hypothetical protein